MENTSIEILNHEWHEMVGNVYLSDGLEIEKLRKLFRETKEVLEIFGNSLLIPKPLAEVLLTMKIFESALHDTTSNTAVCVLYDKVADIIVALKNAFFSGNFELNAVKIDELIESLGE